MDTSTSALFGAPDVDIAKPVDPAAAAAMADPDRMEPPDDVTLWMWRRYLDAETHVPFVHGRHVAFSRDMFNRLVTDAKLSHMVPVGPPPPPPPPGPKLARRFDPAAAAVGRGPSVLEYAPDHFLLYRGKVHLVFGKSGAGKTFSTLVVAGRLAVDGEQVAIISYELLGDEVNARIGELRLSPETLERIAFYGRDDLAGIDLDDLVADLGDHVDIVVLDSASKAGMAWGPYDTEKDEGETILFFDDVRRLPGTVIVIDHVRKTDSRSKAASEPYGSHKKLEEVDGAGWACLVAEKGPGGVGVKRVAWVCRKDNAGPAGHAVDATTVEFVVTDDSVEIGPPSAARPQSAKVPDDLDAQVLALVTASPGIAVRALSLPGRRDGEVRAAALRLAEDGQIVRRREGQAIRHYPEAPRVW